MREKWIITAEDAEDVENLKIPMVSALSAVNVGYRDAGAHLSFRV